MNTIKPLYFSFNSRSSGFVQNIYKNFSSLSLCLEKCAEKYWRTLKNLFPSPEENPIATISTDIVNEGEQPTIQDTVNRTPDNIILHVSVTNLIDKYSENRTFVLGFLMALIERSERDFALSEKKWMKFHADQRDLQFPTKSITEFKQFIGERRDYCVFLDEFVGHNWAVLIRNLIRTVGMTCIVANTNTNIANLVGASQSVFSRRQGDSTDYEVWCIIFSQLNYCEFRLY